MTDDGGPTATGGEIGSGAAPVSRTHHGASQISDQQNQVPILNRSRNLTWPKAGPSVRVSGIETTNSFFNPVIKLNRVDSYFVGPRDMEAHSKLPYCLRIHGSVTPRMLLPLFLVGAWSTCITCMSKFVYPLAVNTLLLNVLGFVVGLALSFHSASAYERYSDGRKAWTTLSLQSRNLARYIWIHIDERSEFASIDLLSKVSAINLILAFAVSLKHNLRFEPYAHYPDLASLVGHLDTFATAARGEAVPESRKKTPWKVTGEYLGLSFASSNPRKALKRASAPLGHLPLEILNYLSGYFDEVSVNGTLKSSNIHSEIMTSLAALTDTMSTAERVLTTPLPVGYNILISQIVLLYVYLLPFQLYTSLGWVTIPGTLAGAYIILGLAAIGNELENPFGNDVNDLPLDQYCAELAREMDLMCASKPGRFSDVVVREANTPLWPLSQGSHGDWCGRSEADIRAALKARVRTRRILAEKGQVNGQTKEKSGSGSESSGSTKVDA